MTSYELLPCPFCGAEAKPVFSGSCNYVTCSNEDGCWCSLTCPTRTPEEAVRIWNRRTIDRPTCHVVKHETYYGSFGCEEAGELWTLSCGDECINDSDFPPRHCPNCGAVVVEKEEDNG